MLSPGTHDFTAPKALPAERIRLPRQLAHRARLGHGRGRRLARPQLRRPPRLPGARLARPPREVKVLLDGKPISAADAGSDVHGGAVTVTGQRLYNLVNLPKVGHHVLNSEPEAGVQGYAFTFG